MNRDGHHDAQLFVGTEVEHSPAHGLRTLFVVGVQDTAVIEAGYNAHRCEHIYFGANQSFPNLAVNDSVNWSEWEKMIRHFLVKNIMCTLDLDVSCVEGLAESELIEHNNFIPMISVKIPYIRLLNYNATIKLDDKDFRASNPGVWCHSLHTLMQRSKFTDWSQYAKDTRIL